MKEGGSDKTTKKVYTMKCKQQRKCETLIGQWTGCTKESKSRFKEWNGADINIESKAMNYVQYKSKCASKNISK